MKDLSSKDIDSIDIAKIRKIGVAFGVYGETMGAQAEASKNTKWDTIDSLIGGVVSSIGSFFGFGCFI